MDKTKLEEIISSLREYEEFLDDCDEGLAGEVSVKDKIAGRIFTARKELTALRRELEAEMKKL